MLLNIYINKNKNPVQPRPASIPPPSLIYMIKEWKILPLTNHAFYDNLCIMHFTRVVIMRILAVCTANIARSIMFEHIFSKLDGLEVKSCGLYPAKRFNEKATAFYDLKGIIPTKPAPESYSVYQHADPFDVVVYLSNKANEIPRYGFGDPLQIQSEFPDPLSGAIEFRELYNTYKSKYGVK